MLLVLLAACSRQAVQPLDMGWIGWDSHGVGEVVGRVGDSESGFDLPPDASAVLWVEETTELGRVSHGVPVSGLRRPEKRIGEKVNVRFEKRNRVLHIVSLQAEEALVHEEPDSVETPNGEGRDRSLAEHAIDSAYWAGLDAQRGVFVKGRTVSWRGWTGSDGPEGSVTVVATEYLADVPVQHAIELAFTAGSKYVHSGGEERLIDRLIEMPEGTSLEEWMGDKALFLLGEDDGHLTIRSVKRLDG